MRKGDKAKKVFGAILILMVVGSLYVSVVSADNPEEFYATAYYCVYESEMDGTQTITKTISGTTYTLKASFLFGGHGVAMQGTGRTGPGGNYIHYTGGGGSFVSIDDPIDDAAVRQRYANIGITDFTGFGLIGLNYPSQATYSRVPEITGASGRTLIPWYSIAVDPSEILLGTTGSLLFKSGTTPEGATKMSFRADDTGGGIVGKHVDIYVGEGESARDEWYETGGNRNVYVTTLTIGDIVRVTTNLNVRTGPGTSYPEILDPDYPGSAPIGTIGIVLNGPSNANGYTWWEVDYGPGLYSGWSVEGGLEKVDDNILPTVDAFDVTPRSVTLDDAFTIPYTVSDTGGSGLKQVELWRKGTGSWEQIEVTSLVGEGDGPYSNSFSDAPPSVGTYLYGIHVVDNAGNLGLEPDPPGPIEVTVTATPSIDLSPSSYGFGDMQVGQCSPEYSFTLTNTGGGTATGSVSLTGTHATQFTITQGSGSFSLATGASKTIKVKFCPTSTGAKSATLFADGSNCNDDSSSLSGTGTQTPSIDLSPSSYGFGDMQVGQCSPEYSFTLTNTGGGTATGSVSLTGTHATQFTITQGSGSFSLATGASKTIKVKFCPTSTGAKSATLFADGSNCNDDSSSLSGTGVENPELSYSPTSHDFGNKCEGVTDSTTFEIWNSGTGTLTYSLSESCGWMDVNPTSGSSTEEHDTITVDIDTTGLSEGFHTCDITINSNGGSGTFTVTVNVVLCGNMGVDPTSWSPPTLNCGESDSQIVTVSATGGVVEGVTASKISGETWVTLSQTSLGDIPSGSSKTFTMTAAPPAGTSSGDYPYTIRVSNTCGTPSTRDVAGTINVKENADGQTDYWAVIVGVADYTGTSYDLEYTDDDAIDMYNTLLLSDHWQPDHIKLLLDSEADKAGILTAFDWLDSNEDPEDVVLFFFSGHGTYGPDDDGDELDGWDEYICPCNFNNIRDDELDAELDRLESTSIVVIIDSCFAGGMTKAPDRSVKTLLKQKVELTDGFAKDIQDEKKDMGDSGRVVLMACDDDEYSYEISLLENGLFSYYVIEALQGCADAEGNGDNICSAEETFVYASPRVVDYISTQNPQLYDEYPGELPITRPPCPDLSYSPASHNYGDKCEGETDSTTFELWNSGTGTLTYSLSETCDWLEVQPTSGSSTGEHDTITVDIGTTSLFEGFHTCDITINSNGGSGTFTVMVNVVSCPCGNMGVNPTSWSTTVNCSESDNEIVTVSATGGTVKGVTGSKVSGPTWLSVSPTDLGDIASGSSKTFTMTASPPSETSGNFGYTIRVSNTCGTPSTLDVSGTINVSCPCGNMGVNSTSWSPTLNCSESDNEIVTVSVSDNIVNGVTVSKVSGPTWLSVSPTNLGDIASGSSKTFTMTTSPPSGTSGDFPYTVTVSNTCGNPSSRDVAGTIHVDYPESSWTYMVYLDGDNNLEGAAIDDFMEMSSVGSTSDVNIVVQFDRIPGYSSAYGDWTGCKRFHVTSGMTPMPANATEDLGECNMGDPNTLRDFVAWTMTEFPADNYALILWNHGDGWKSINDWVPWADDIKDAKDAGLTRGICWDNTNNDYLSLQETEQALTGKYVQLLGYDACLMHMIEVVYQVMTNAGVSVGSEEVEPGDGWPYNTILSALTGTPTMNEDALGRVIVDRYMASYPTPNALTQSAMDNSALPNLVAAVDNLAQTLINEINAGHVADVQQARSKTEEIYYAYYIDLYHFAEMVDAYVPGATTEAQAVMNEVSGSMYEAHGTSVPNDHGLSIYYPRVEGDYLASYDSTAFAIDTKWDEFLKRYYNPPIQGEDIGVFRAGLWILPPNYRFNFGMSTDRPITGDWNGNGVDTIGVRRGRQWILSNSNAAPSVAYRVNWAMSTDIQITGDWDGDGVDTIGVRRGRQWILSNSNTAPSVAIRVNYGLSTDIPVVGDWNGDGVDTIGVRRGRQWILSNSNTAPVVAYRVNYGMSTDIPVVGDWNGDGVDTIGVRRGRQWILSNSNAAPSVAYRFNWGLATDEPVTGDWI